MGYKEVVMKKGFILIAIGILFLAIDIPIPMGDAYPTMEIIDGLGVILQENIINNIIGTGPMIDILSDIIGYIFLFLGLLFMVKHDKSFIIGMILIPFAIFLYITIMRLPYNYILRDLYLKAAGYHFLMVIVEISTELFVIRGIVNILQSMQTNWNVNELLFGWILAMISKVILSGIQFFFSKGILYYAYTLVLIGATVFYLNRLYVISKYKLEDFNEKK